MSWFKVQITSGDKKGWFAGGDIVGRTIAVPEGAAGLFTKAKARTVQRHFATLGYKSRIIEAE